MNRFSSQAVSRRGRKAGAVAYLRGYTLLELLITLAIIALVASTMGPNMIGMIDRNRKSSQVNNLFSMLVTTRSYAVELQDNVVVCATTSQAACNTTNWEQGWVMFQDNGAGAGATAGDGSLDGDEPIIRVGQAAGGNLQIRTVNFTSAGVISFDRNGLANDVGTFVLCDNNGISQASGVVLSVSGQARLAVRDGDGDLLSDVGAKIAACPT